MDRFGPAGSFEKTGPPFEVVLFSRSDRSEFCLNGSRPYCPYYPGVRKYVVEQEEGYLEDGHYSH